MSGTPSLRNTFKTSPQMGLPPRWTVGDLPLSYAVPIPVLTAISTPTTSSVIAAASNSIVVLASFADPNTGCDILVQNLVNGSYVQVAQFLKVNMFNCSNMYVGQLDQDITLNGNPIKIIAQNFTSNSGIAPGQVTISINKLN